MTVKIKSIAVFCLIFVMMFAMTACSSKKKEEEYLTKFQACLDQLTTLNTTMTKDIETYLKSFTEEDKATLNATVDAVSKAYVDLKALEAPKGFEDIQALFADGADKAAPALEIYKKEFSAVTADTFNEDFVTRIAEGDKIMEEANRKLIDAGEKVEEKLGASSKTEKKDDKSSSDESNADDKKAQESSSDEKQKKSNK